MKFQSHGRIGLTAFVATSLFFSCGVKPAPTEEQAAALLRGGPPVFVLECERLLKDCEHLRRPRLRDACVREVLRGECGHPPHGDAGAGGAAGSAGNGGHLDAGIPLDAPNDVRRDANGVIDVGEATDGSVAGHDAASDGSGQVGTCVQLDPNAVWEAGSGFKTTVGTVSSMWTTSSSDVWASTNSLSLSRFGTTLGTTIQHWNGTTWAAIVGPVGVQAIESLWASGPSDLWVASTNGLWRWNGTVWTNVTPFPQGNDIMTRVWGFGPSDVWALGGVGVSHWDGASWTDYSSVISTSVPPPSDAPPQTGEGSFQPLSVWGATTADVWMGGSLSYLLFPTGPGTLSTVALSGYAHWDGVAWTVESPTTVAEALFGEIGDVRGTSADNIWAVGDSVGNTQPEVIEHYDGVSWTRQSNVPSTGPLSRLWGTCPSDFWAIGFSSLTDNLNNLTPVLLHFDGSVWTTVPTPFISTLFSLNAVTGTDANDLWVGFGDIVNSNSVTNGFAYHRHL